MVGIITFQHDKIDREKRFTQLYLDVFPVVAKYISKQGGNLELAKDVFQEAVLIYYKQIQSKSNLEVEKETAYLFGISRHVYFKKVRKQQHFIPLENMDIREEDDDSEISSNKVLAFLETAGARCMDLLKSFYYDKLPLSKIAQKMGYSNVRSATVQKYKCLEKVRDQIKENNVQYEDFLN